MRLYADSNKDWFPTGKGKDNLELLIEGGYLDKPQKGSDILKCPNSNKSPSYAYVGEGLRMAHCDPRLPIVVDYPKNHQGSVNITFFNGHVATYALPEGCTTLTDIIQYICLQEGIECKSPKRCAHCRILENARKYY